MKKNSWMYICFFLWSLFHLSACVVHINTKASKPLPPGQAKKITGEKSAKNHAPGHQKKGK